MKKSIFIITILLFSCVSAFSEVKPIISGNPDTKVKLMVLLIIPIQILKILK